MPGIPKEGYAMSEDRLEEIKFKTADHLGETYSVPVDRYDINWLISELEQSWAEVKELEERINKWRQGVEDADIMGMEWKERALKTTKRKLRYQGRAVKAEAEVARLKKMQPIANVTLSDDAKYFEGLANKAEAEVKRLKAILANKGIAS